MTYGRLLTPRFYPDSVNHYASRGATRSTMITDKGGSYNTGYNKYQLFDLNPLNYASFATDAGTSTVSVQVDFGEAVSCNYVAILNHNIGTSGGKFRIARSASTMSAGGGTDATGISQILNASSISEPPSAIYVTPANDGDTIVSMNAQSYRYWLFEFEDVATWSDDLIIGSIMIGTYYDSTVAPDITSTRENAFSGVSNRQAYAGKDFAFASHLQPNTGAYSPFLDSSEYDRFGSRRAYDFTTSYLADSNVYPSDHADANAASNFMARVWNKVGGSFLPFIFQVNNLSTTKGDFIFARFDSNIMQTSRPSNNTETLSTRVVQVF